MNKYTFKFDSQINARDKKVGQLQRVVLNAEATHITHFIIKQGMLFKNALVLPLSAVDTAYPDGITLSLYSDEVKKHPIFEKQVVKSGVPQFEAVSEQMVRRDLQLQSIDQVPHMDAGLYTEETVIRQGLEPDDILWNGLTTVHNRQGQVGHLSHVIVNAEDGRIHELVMRQGKVLEKFLVIPMGLLEHCNETTIHIAVENQEIDDLLEYFNYASESTTVSDRETSPSPLEGEKPFTNPLVIELTALLAEDPRTETAVIELICEGGTVTLAGTVADQETKEAAADIVSQHPDVITVNSTLQLKH